MARIYRAETNARVSSLENRNGMHKLTAVEVLPGCLRGQDTVCFYAEGATGRALRLQFEFDREAWNHLLAQWVQQEMSEDEWAQLVGSDIPSKPGLEED
jgi:hypothetical protein